MDIATTTGSPDQPAQVFEFAVEFGFGFEYFEVPGPNEKTARSTLWDEILTCEQRDAVSNIECTEQRAAQPHLG